MKKRSPRPKPARGLHRRGPTAAQISAALAGIGRGGDSAAIPVLEAALDADPKQARCAHGLGLALLHLGQVSQAQSWLSEASRLAPHDLDIEFAQAFLDYSTGRYAEAVARLIPLRAADPQDARVANVLGDGLRLLGRLDEALAVLPDAGREGLGTLVGVRAETCDWAPLQEERHVLEADLRNQLDAGQTPSLQPFGAIKAQISSKLVKRLGAAKVPPVPRRVHRARPARDRLRIGYLSSDLYDHPVGLLFAPILESHDTNRVETRCYALAHRRDHVRARIDAVGPVVDLAALDDSAAAERIAMDELDLLVDLVGFTNAGRCGLLARRPAPLQAHFLGYPGSLPRSLVDFNLLSLARLTSEGIADYDERVVLLPETFVASEGFGAVTGPASRRELGLPDDAFVLGFFGAAYRIEPRVFAAWMEILRSSADSVLWIAVPEHTRDRLRTAATSYGIPASRLYFTDPSVLSRSWHHTCCDLWLDGWHVSSGTASIVAMWSHTPILTLAGPTPQSRTGAGVLAGAEQVELVAHSPREYVEKAVSWIRGGGIPEHVRTRLHTSRTRPLFDVPRFVRHLEDAFEMMVSARHGRAPIVVPARARRAAPEVAAALPSR